MIPIILNKTRKFGKFTCLSLLLLTSYFNGHSNGTDTSIKEDFLNVNKLAITDKAGEQVEHPGFSASSNISGYLVYLPEDYYSNPTKDYPVVIFLHGSGETGTYLPNVRRVGLPKDIDNGEDYPFIVISPQSPHSGWSIGGVDLVVDMAFQNYRADEKRLYITGLSMGGAGTWNYTTYYAERVAAAVPICGWGPVHDAAKMKNVPVWATHNSGDNVVGVDGTINMVNALRNAGANPDPIQIIYPTSGHDAWTATYNDDDMWDWLLSKSKSGTVPNPPANKVPVAKAGNDQSIKLPTNSINLSGSGSDSDGSISSYLWTKTSGPTATMTDSNKAVLKLTNLLEGTYIFKLTVTDNKGSKGSDEVKVTVLPSDTVKPPNNGENGLLYTYYEGTFSVLPDFSKLKSTSTGYVNTFDLSPRKRNDNFTFNFEGQVEIEKSGDYTFYTSSDDGSKLYIDGKQIVDNDGLHGLKEKSGKIYLNAGRHNIKVAYFENLYGETLDVKYAGPSISKKSIPANLLFKPTTVPVPTPPTASKNGLFYTYYEGNFDKLPDFSKLNSASSGYVNNFDITPRKRNDYFAFTFAGKIEITTDGEYTFYTNSDDGSKLYINGKKVVDNDGLHANSEKNGKVKLSPGLHDIRVEFFEKNYGETLGVKYAGPGVGKQAIPSAKLFKSDATPSQPAPTENGLLYTYYEGEFNALPNFDNTNSVSKGYVNNVDLGPRKRNDHYAFTFEGQIEISKSGDYKFYTNSDDGSKLYINGKEIVNNDGLHGDREKEGKIKLSSGMHDIKVTFFEKQGDQILGIKYAGPGVGKQAIPSSKLFRPASYNTSAEIFSSITTIQKGTVEEKEITESFIEGVYPNPVVNEINVKLFSKEDQIIKIMLIDFTGKILVSFDKNLSKGQNNFKIDTQVDNIKKGLFILRISLTEGKVINHKLIKN